MLIVRIIRFLTGYVSFTATGGFIERFVNLCTKNKIPLWNLKRRDDFLKADTTVNGYKNIRESAKRSGVRVSIEQKHGLPFFMHKYRKRCGILAGMGFAILVTLLLSSMIWTINVSGNTELTDEQVIEAFYETGVKIGALKSKIDCTECAFQVTRKLPELTFASVNIIGSRAEIVVNERSTKPDFLDNSKPSNIVSTDDGVILSIDANIGKAEIKAGDAVLKGDLLISGITQNADGSENLKCAKGKVFAKVKKQIDTKNTDFIFRTQKSIEKCLYIYLLGLKIPLGATTDKNTSFYSTEFLTNGDITLPIGIVKSNYFTLEDENELPEKYKSLYCARCFSEKYRELYQHSEQILSQTMEHNKIDGYISFFGEYEIKKDIGVNQAILVDIS